ncbi:MAG: 2-oxoglutarate and iron-dependent oxygenase domain-containing protein, partial [Burkholderiales bacterium]|nr:2-oxoglutarate and iron-dependent oxygenase domain-containing protein [Burkholderiales bacterium]
MIPVLDLQGALAPDGPRSAEVAQQLRAAALDSGFFYVRGHGIDAGRQRQQFALARRLLELPAARREALSMRRSPILRGFENLG